MINKNNYDYFIFLNTSVKGPYIKCSNKRWQKYFLEMITNDTKLVGTTINICTEFNDLFGIPPPYIHVQSQMMAMDKECLEFLQHKIFIPLDPNYSMYDVIQNREIAMSQLVLKNNWNINCILPKYKDLDYRTITKDINPTSVNGDPSYEGAYFGSTYTPYDVIFIKANRNLDTIQEGFTNYVSEQKYSLLQFVTVVMLIIAFLLLLFIYYTKLCKLV